MDSTNMPERVETNEKRIKLSWTDVADITQEKIGSLLANKTIKHCFIIDALDGIYWRFVFTDDSALMLSNPERVDYGQPDPPR